MDGITVGRFGKDSQIRLLVVKEHINKSTYQLGARQTSLNRQTRQRGKATPGDTHRHRPHGAYGTENGHPNRFLKTVFTRTVRVCGPDAVVKTPYCMWKTSSTPMPGSWVRSTAEPAGACARSCANGAVAKAEAGEKTPYEGPTAFTSPNLASAVR